MTVDRIIQSGNETWPSVDIVWFFPQIQLLCSSVLVTAATWGSNLKAFSLLSWILCSTVTFFWPFSLTTARLFHQNCFQFLFVWMFVLTWPYIEATLIMKVPFTKSVWINYEFNRNLSFLKIVNYALHERFHWVNPFANHIHVWSLLILHFCEYVYLLIFLTFSWI